MSERAWYQDGFVVIVVIFVAVLFGPQVYKAFQQQQMGGFAPRLSGQITQPIFGSKEFVAVVYHQNPGVLRNGTLTITLKSPMLANPKGVETKTYSFEEWNPNEEHSVELRFPLSSFDNSTRIEVETRCTAKNIRDYSSKDAWIADGWVSNQKK
jgi:hypothetical protein